MPDIVKTPGWNRQFKSHDKANRRLLTGAEAAEKDANNREQAANREARLLAIEALSLSYDSGPLLRPTPPPPNAHSTDIETVPERPFNTDSTTLAAPAASLPQLAHPFGEEEEEEEKEAVEEPPPSTAPAMMQVSRAGRKRAPTMKALEAEKAPKWGIGKGKARGPGRGARGAKQ